MPRKPVWSEGVLISQHHFQQADGYHESLLAARLRSLHPHEWGVVALEIDAAALAGNQLRLRRFEGSWPDGTYLRCGDGMDQPPPAPVDLPAEVPASGALDVYLGLADPGHGGALLARPDEPKGDRRYVQSVRTVRDENTGASPHEIEWAEPLVRVFVGDDARQGYQVVRIAQIVRSGAGSALVRDNHVPPCLHVGAAPFLQSGLRRVLTAAVARQQDLVADSGERAGGRVDFHAAAARRFWLLHTLSGAIAELSHVVESPRTHPERAYLVLARFAGQLSSISGAAGQSQIPKFDYSSLGNVFEPLFARIVSLLSEGVESPYVEVQLERRVEDGMYLGSFSPASLLDQELFVAIRSAQPDALVRDRAPEVLKVASWNEIYEVVKQARRGVRLAVEWNPSSALPQRPGTCFFRIKKEGSHWKDVERSATVALALPEKGAWKGTGVALYAVESRHVA